MEVKNKRKKTDLIEVFTKSINENDIYKKFSFFFNILSFKRCIFILYSNITKSVKLWSFSKYEGFYVEKFSIEQIEKLLNYKNKFVKKNDLQFINFENAYIFHSLVDNDKDILVIYDCEKGKKYTDDKKLLELFSTCYSAQLNRDKLELIEKSHMEIIDSINEGVVAIKNGTIIMKNKLGEEILRGLPEITTDNFYGERIINTFIKDDFRSIHFIREKIDDVDLFLFEDITEKTKMMNSIIKMKNFHILGELTAGVAHEINNPLQIVLGIAQLIDLTDKNLAEETKKYIEMIKDSSLRIKKIIEFLSSYMEHTKISKEENIFSISSSIKSAYDSVYNLENLIGIALSYDIKEDFTVKGDLHKVIIAIENLILNSVEAIKAKNKSGKITIRAFKEGNNGIVEVEDDGIGIKEDHIHKIFDTFFTTKKNGAGLGLGIVRRVLLMHKGSVELVRTGGGITTFKLIFPIEYE